MQAGNNERVANNHVNTRKDFSVFSVFLNIFTSRSVQLGNNERVADDHEKTREEKEDDVDQAVVHLRCED